MNLGFEPFENGVFLYTQYYYGYVENLLTYKKLTNKLSIGFLIAY
ncbi:MAG TPA: phospholipase A [Campylobacter avium]|nr:phospholipase A [Campylobacter avium]